MSYEDRAAEALREAEANHDAWFEAQPYEEDPDGFEIEAVADEEILPTRPKRRLLAKEAVAAIEAHRVLDIDKLFLLPEIEWFVEDFLPHTPRTMIHGLGGSYKSFLTLDWMLCAAVGKKWHGHTVRKGRVLYIAGEGLQGISKRVRAWCEHNGYQPEELMNRFRVMGTPINLHAVSDHAIDVWAGYIDFMEYDYVVVDTLHTATAGGEENSSTDMGLALQNATRIGGDNVSLFFVHHTVKSGGTHRGSGALRDDMDVVVSLRAVEGADYTAQLTTDKIRDADPFRPTNIVFLKRGDGLQSSLVVDRVITGAKKESITPKIPSAVEKAKDAITEHGLDIDRGEKHISEQLRSLNLGLNFAPATVGKALKELRGASQEIKSMQVRNIELDPEDQ